jgi:hypothetical protein
MPITKDQTQDFLIECINKGIKDEATKILERKIEETKKELEQRTPEIIAGIIVNVMRSADLQILQDRIIFTIKKNI